MAMYSIDGAGTKSSSLEEAFYYSHHLRAFDSTFARLSLLIRSQYADVSSDLTKSNQEAEILG